MKIYPNNVSILTVDKPSSNDIILGYLDSNKTYNATLHSCINNNGIHKVAPYQAFPYYDCKLFKPLYGKESNNPNDYAEVKVELKRVGAVYQYVPTAAVSFVPARFNYSLIGKKTLTYNEVDIFNLKIGCIDNNNALVYSLIQIFADAPSKGLCPHNLYVNNQDLSIEQLTTGSIADKDIVFIQSPEGKFDKAGNVIDYNSYLSNHTNAWVCVENLNTIKNQTVTLKSPILYDETIKHSDYLFEKATFQESYVPAPDSEISLFDNTAQAPVIIKHYKNKGFIIISTYDLMYYCKTNYKLIYEILSYIYFNTYLETENYTQWITDVMPDYIIKNNTFSTENNFHSPQKYYEMFGFNYPTKISLSDIKISNADIDISVYNDYIVFSKNSSEKSDPIKKDGQYSIFTERQNVIYVEEIFYTIEQDIQSNVRLIYDDTNYKVKFDNFKHTTMRLDLTGEKQPTLLIPLVETINFKDSPILAKRYSVYCSNNALFLKEYSAADLSRSDMLMVISVSRIDSNFEIRDMRRRGGGLPKDKPSDYNLFDIASFLGRPYRKEGTLIFKLPTRYKPHHEIICKIIEQHIAASKQYLIVYKKEEGEV